jgi:PAS domain S-box-containing protein
MGIDLKDLRFTFSDEAPPPSLPPAGAPAQRNGHTTGLHTPLEVDAYLAEVYRRDELLKVVSNSITAVLTADSVKESLPHAMQQIAQVVSIDRMIVSEMRLRADLPPLRIPYFIWTVPGAPLVNPSVIEPRNKAESDHSSEWSRSLKFGHAIFGSQRTSPPAIAGILSRMDAISILIVPIMIGGQHWGQIGFHDCNNERDWTADEISPLKLFADVVGVAITRERSMEELLEANSEIRAIFQAIPDLVFRLDHEGTILSVKAGAGGEMPQQELSGRRIQECWLKYSGDGFSEVLRRVIDEKSMVSIEHSEGAKGQESFHEVRLVPLLRDQVVAIARNITERKSAEAKLEQMHKELTDASRQAGMAQIANNVLHNVGNVLNSVNVSASLIGGRIRDSKVQGLAKAVQLMNEHATDLGDFLTRDERGIAFPAYLNMLVAALAEEKQSITDELGSLTKGIDHIKEIVGTQQSYSGATSLIEPVQIKDLMEDALRMNAASMARHQITVIKEFADVPLLLLDKHLVLQILINLIGNAKHAMNGLPDRSHQITLRVNIAEPPDEPRLTIRVEDNGEGIAPENLARLFAHGFTTRKNGHGFGLHSCALAAKEMNGTMTAHSNGPGKGSVFTLELPVNRLKGLE